MRIATWNIGGGFISSKQKHKFDTEDIGYFIDELKKIQPDIICFQEIHVSENNDQPKMIAKSLGFKFCEVESIANSHLKDGEKLSIAIISKYPIISSKFNLLLNPNLHSVWSGKEVISHDKGFLEVKINYQSADVRILSGHMVPFHKFDQNFLADELKEIRNQVDKTICREKIPTVIGADMNFEDIHKLIPNIFRQGFNSILDDKVTTPKGKKMTKLLFQKIGYSLIQE